MVRPKLSGRGALAATADLDKCVFTHDCPVVKVHCSFGFARHVGQVTDKICRSVRAWVCTPPLSDMQNREDVQLCSFEARKRTLPMDHPAMGLVLTTST